MKTAILISGQFRSGAHCFPSIKKHVLDKLGDHDVIAHLARDEDASGIAQYQPRIMAIVDQPVLDEKNYVHRSGRQVFGIQQCLRMWWSMRESHKLMLESNQKYDWVVRLRPDLQFFKDMEPLAELDPNEVYVPTFHNWWGYNDRFAIMGAKWAATYHSLFDQLDSYIAQGGIFHPETFLKWVLDEAGVHVKRTGVVFDTIRNNGLRVPAAWHASIGDIT